MLRSALMSGQVGAIVPAERFPLDNLLIHPERYTYEGNWLFCSFPGCEVRAARLGFGQGAFGWEDYGLEAAPAGGVPLAYRLELITPRGVDACLFSGQYPERPIASHPERIDMSFRENGGQLFLIEGWPRMRWQFRAPDQSMTADLAVSAESVVIWPDCVMPHNTFSMAIATCSVEGSVAQGGREVPVSGAGFFDHPRVLVEDNPQAPSFGWYLYAPISFPSGWMLAAYHAEDGNGDYDASYSAAFFTAPDGKAGWLPRSRSSRLRFDQGGFPRAWEMALAGGETEIRCHVRVETLEPVRVWTSGERPEPGRYLAYPLLMHAEAEYTNNGTDTLLEHGRGIAEFLVRKGYEPRYP
jgi:hypothetical protein